MLASPAATEAMRMSRLLTWLISCPKTPRNSRSSSTLRIPVVTQCDGLRPVANAWGSSWD